MQARVNLTNGVYNPALLRRLDLHLLHEPILRPVPLVIGATVNDGQGGAPVRSAPPRRMRVRYIRSAGRRNTGFTGGVESFAVAG
jgi:hypothetical protein